MLYGYAARPFMCKVVRGQSVIAGFLPETHRAQTAQSPGDIGDAAGIGAL